ncbi:hypothetical protein ACIBL3_37575 [Kribbella sp. NPDC050124]|uniref:hypothetical protein n=1 Tax=Kribbella sp. NPDC050124 TaxID=3364114 RepID=UPI0037B3EEEE
MILTNEFEVKAAVEDAWPLLVDIPRAAWCLPGAELESSEGGRPTREPRWTPASSWRFFSTEWFGKSSRAAGTSETPHRRSSGTMSEMSGDDLASVYRGAEA